LQLAVAIAFRQWDYLLHLPVARRVSSWL